MSPTATRSPDDLSGSDGSVVGSDADEGGLPDAFDEFDVPGGHGSASPDPSADDRSADDDDGRVVVKMEEESERNEDENDYGDGDRPLKGDGPEGDGDTAGDSALADGGNKDDADADGRSGGTPSKGATGRKKAEDGHLSKAAPVPDGKPLPPPSWPDVSFLQLVNYPKMSLRAQSYFDIQQIRAIKPVTLSAMGISVPKFPNIEEDPIVKIAVQRGTRHHMQLYHPADVLASKKRAKPHLQKEMLRRAILYNLKNMGEDACHNDIPKVNALRQKQGLRGGMPTYLPRPGSYSNSQCLDWLRNTPPPPEEHEFILKSVKQWRQQVRDQIGCQVGNKPMSKEVETALAIFDAAAAEEAEGGEEEEDDMAAPDSATPAVPTIPAIPTPKGANGQLNVAGAQLKSPFEAHTLYPPNAPNVMNFNAPSFSVPPAGGGSYHDQLAASVNLNNMQAQAIYQYQNQLAALHGQLQGPSGQTRFEICVSKDTFKFNASHFVAFKGFRERLHGHAYRVTVRLIGGNQIRNDGYVLDFGCVKSAAKEVCKELNEYLLIPMLSDVLSIRVVEDTEDGDASPDVRQTRKRKRAAAASVPGSVTVVCEDGSTFVFPKQDCLLLPIMHTTAEELAVYLYGKILKKLEPGYLLQRGVGTMELTVSEAKGQDAMFRHAIPAAVGEEFDVAAFINKEKVPEMPCATETEGAKCGKQNA